MPDLQSELTKALNSWSDDMTPTKAPNSHLFQTTTNVSRATFEFIRDNKGVARSRAVDTLVSQGYKKSSVSTLIVQFIKGGQIRDAGGFLFANQNEYSPIRRTSSNPNKPKRAKRAGRAYRVPYIPRALRSEEPSEAIPLPVTMQEAEWSVDTVLDNLTVKQAHLVYIALEKMFGGN